MRFNIKIIAIIAISLLILPSAIALASKNSALNAINSSEKIISSMAQNNLSTLHLNDLLSEAKRIFDQATYAEILQNEVPSTKQQKDEASQAMRLIDWKNITYNQVLQYTEEIKSRKETAYLLLDKISLAENKAESSKDYISKSTLSLLDQAKTAFKEERYNETQTLLDNFEVSLEKESTSLSTISGIQSGAKNFFQRYWLQILIILIIAIIVLIISYKKIARNRLKNKIRKMKAEQEAIHNLMKKAQTERFKEDKISGLVYNIRMKTYQEKLEKIKEELPILEARLRKAHPPPYQQKP